MAYVWSIWKQNVGINQIERNGEVICFAAKWHGEPAEATQFYSIRGGKTRMLEAAHGLLSEADVVVHYNGDRFDTPHLNGEFLLAGMNPPAPFKSIDLLKTFKRRFRFVSNKLDYVSQRLEIGSKVKHEGFELWLKCMQGDDDAWSRMRTYNVQDVVLLEDLYERVKPWVVHHPNVPLIDGVDGDARPVCAGKNLRREGHRITVVGKFQRYQCRDCGSWSTSGKRSAGTDLRVAAL
jgi:hypothetical protein